MVCPPDDTTDRHDEAGVEAPTPRMLAWARNSAAYRLGKRMHTEKQLSDAIRRKAREKFEGISEAQLAALAAVAVRFGYDNLALDDQAYAEVATRSGARSGRSRRAMTQRLLTKGIDRDTASTVVAAMDDLHAAVVLARKRAFGPFRREAAAEESEAASHEMGPAEKRRAKELSAFMRAGFAFEIARAVTEMGREEADELLSGGDGGL